MKKILLLFNASATTAMQAIPISQIDDLSRRMASGSVKALSGPEDSTAASNEQGTREQTNKRTKKHQDLSLSKRMKEVGFRFLVLGSWFFVHSPVLGL
ncbi:MAG TPA: hypothetical protein VGD58_19705 [Herpetosiphonaceae bacterium]